MIPGDNGTQVDPNLFSLATHSLTPIHPNRITARITNTGYNQQVSVLEIVTNRQSFYNSCIILGKLGTAKKKVVAGGI